MNHDWLPQPRPRHWQAKWIWPANAPSNESNVYAYFRQTFELEQAPAGHSLFITADRFYQVFLNGKRLGSGPPPSAPWYHYYDAYDLSEELQPGTNCLAVLVYHVSAQPFGDADGRGRGGLLVELTDADGSPALCSDATWRATLAAPWQRNTYEYGNVLAPYVECFDARREPQGWQQHDFDDQAWPAASVIHSKRRPECDTPPVAGPWSKLVPREIPFLTYEKLLPQAVVHTEESVDLKLNITNLGPGLSMAGQPIRYARCEAPESLCTPQGGAVFESSKQHLDLDFGSLYAPAVVLDFGRIVVAHLELELEGAAGGIIDIGYAERLVDGRFNIAVDGAAIADRYIMKDGPQTFRTFTWKAFRYLKLRFRHCPQPVTVRSVNAELSLYPYEERGAFDSTDGTLNRVFEICRNTVRLCSQDCLLADPWREKAQWLGDVSLVTVPTIHTCFGDTALPGQFLMQAGQHQFPTGILANVSNFNSQARYRTWTKTIPDYSLWWIGAVCDQYLYTGDENLLHRLYPQMLRILDTHLDYLNDRMLIENLPYWLFIDWADVDKEGMCGVYNAIFYRTLGCLQQLARAKGDAYTVNLTGRLRAAIAASFDDTFFDPERGCYVDANQQGSRSDKLSEHGNMTPIWAGLCDADRALDLAATVFEGGDGRPFTEAQPFYMAVILPALARAGRFDLALDLIRHRWGKRMLATGATSTCETWHANGRWTSGEFLGLLNGHSLAWAACPADFLIRQLLRLQILEPGCTRIQLDPVATDFDYSIAFPTPQGSIEATCSAGTITTTIPPSITANDYQQEPHD